MSDGSGGGGGAGGVREEKSGEKKAEGVRVSAMAPRGEEKGAATVEELRARAARVGTRGALMEYLRARSGRA